MGGLELSAARYSGDCRRADRDAVGRGRGLGRVYASTLGHGQRAGRQCHC